MQRTWQNRVGLLKLTTVGVWGALLACEGLGPATSSTANAAGQQGTAAIANQGGDAGGGASNGGAPQTQQNAGGNVAGAENQESASGSGGQPPLEPIGGNGPGPEQDDDDLEVQSEDDDDDGDANLPTPDAGGLDQSETVDAGGPDSIDESGLALKVADVFSGHPVPFALVTSHGMQFVAYYDASQRMTVASRHLGETTWVYQQLPTSIGWDSHNYIAMAVDAQGHVHVSGNMHNVPLIYFRTEQALDVTSLIRETSMIGRNEQSVTYPEFFVGPEGALVFAHRDGGSGDGNHVFNTYSTTERLWTRLLDTALTDGEGQRNAYPVGPVQGPLGRWHLVWVWRDSPDAATNHDLSYAQTEDLRNWTSGAGLLLELPVRLSTSDIVDDVPANGGMINNNTKVGFDAQNRPVVVYHKYDSSGATQLYNARLEDGQWRTYQTTDWDYRWAFGGTGTLVFEIEVEGVQAQPDGTLTQRYYHAQYGGWGAYRLDPVTLQAVEEIPPPSLYPRELDVPSSGVDGMVVRWQEDWGGSPAGAAMRPDVQYLLRWETLPSNRDEPRASVPPPTELTVYAFDP